MEKKWNDERACEVCGGKYTPKTKNQKMCSSICRDYKSYISRKNSEVITIEEFVQKNSTPCFRCGEVHYKKELQGYTWKRVGEKYCKDCLLEMREKEVELEEERRSQRQLEVEEERKRNSKICPVCGEHFAHSYYKYCSMECWKEAQKDNIEFIFTKRLLISILKKVEGLEKQGGSVDKIHISKGKVLLNNLNGDSILFKIEGGDDE